MLGTFLNVAGVLAGALTGRCVSRNLSDAHQLQARKILTGLTLLTGAAVIASALPPHLGACLKLGFVAVVALSLGSLVGHFLGLQRLLNRLVIRAQESQVSPDRAGSRASGFLLEVVVLTANPLGLVGAVLEGWSGDWRPLALKGVLDALAALGFAVAGSRTIGLAVLPMMAVQGTLTLLAALLAQRFPDPSAHIALQLCAGLVVMAATPVVLGVRRVPLANYLPSLLIAPLLAAWWN